mmetsp:Transcript_2729/g.7544  ORF Transcript_2729/g.7544 Transcript_2729/m.7544 type:complete len:225 (-) Transcript_2729:1228-1902(-)
MRPHATSTRAAASARARSPSTSSRGMRMSLSSSSFARTTARRRRARAICSTRSGCATSSCAASRRMAAGRSSARTSAPGLSTAGGRTLRRCTNSMSARARRGASFRPSSFGSKSSKPKLRRGRRICSTRTQPTASPTSSTSVPSGAPTCARRSSSTRRLTRWPCATSRRSRSRASCLMRTAPAGWHPGERLWAMQAAMARRRRPTRPPLPSASTSRSYVQWPAS